MNMGQYSEALFHNDKAIQFFQRCKQHNSLNSPGVDNQREYIISKR